MNWVDFVMLGFLAFFLIYGFTRGFVRQILGIAGIVAGLFLAARYALTLANADFLQGMRENNPKLTEIAAYLAIFLLISIASGVLIALVWKLFPKRELKATDSFLGAVLGAVQGVLILGGISIGFINWNDPNADPVKASVLAPKFAQGCEALVSLIPEDKQWKIQKEFEESKAAVEEAFEKTAGAAGIHADPPPPREEKEEAQ